MQPVSCVEIVFHWFLMVFHLQSFEFISFCKLCMLDKKSRSSQMQEVLSRRSLEPVKMPLCPCINLPFCGDNFFFKSRQRWCIKLRTCRERMREPGSAPKERPYQHYDGYLHQGVKIVTRGAQLGLGRDKL